MVIPEDLAKLIEVSDGFEVEKSVETREELLALQFENEDGEQQALADNKTPVFSMLEGSTHFIVNNILAPNALKDIFDEFEDPDYTTVV